MPVTLKDDLLYAIGYVQALPTNRKYKHLKPWADQLQAHLERMLACLEDSYVSERRLLDEGDRVRLAEVDEQRGHREPAV